MFSTSGNKYVVWLFASILLIACALPSFLVTQAAPIPQTPIPGILNTIIVQTVLAAQTQTATFLPSATATPTQTRIPSKTSEPLTSTPTFIFAFPTYTKLVIISPQAPGGISYTSVGGTTGNAGPTSITAKTPQAWDCKIIEKNPPVGATFKQKTNLIVSYTIKNTGTKTWTTNGVDFLYTSGYRHDGRRIQDLPVSVAPGRSITLKVSLTTPKAPGTYNVIWSLKVGNRYFCHMKHYFEVK